MRFTAPDFKAKKALLRLFLGLLRDKTTLPPAYFKEADVLELAKYELNGRQIRNTVASAQALAVTQGQPLDMTHFRQVLDVAKDFERDVRGGPAFQDAMNSYC